MSTLPADQKLIDDFIAAIAAVEKAYVHAAFNYIAVKASNRFVIVRGRLFLTDAVPQVAPMTFQSPNIRAGRYTLDELKLNLREFIARLLAGALDTPEGPLCFEAAEGGRHAASFVSFHPDGLQAQRRFNALTLMAGPIVEMRQPDLDWEVKAAARPYDGLQEIATELAIGDITGPTATVEIIALNVSAIDAQRSKVSGTKAEVCVILAKGLSPDRVSLGYRVYMANTHPQRGTVSVDDMEWSDEGQVQLGRTTLDVPAAAVLNCTTSYDGIAQNHYWLADPEKSQNPRRAAYEAFDPKLENLRAAIDNASVRGQDARQLEPAVAMLLWMLGFNIAHLALPRARDAADVLAATPGGHFAVVECTTGLLKAENKLALLYARTEAVRKNLVASNNTYQRVLPVIVTTRTLTDVKVDLEAAERLGVVVITREAIEQLFPRTLIQPDSDQLYAQAEQAVTAALAKYQA